MRLICGNYSQSGVNLIGITVKNVETTLLTQWKPTTTNPSAFAYVTVAQQHVKLALVYDGGNEKITFDTTLEPLHYFTLVVDSGGEHKLLDHGTVPFVQFGVYVTFFNLLVTFCNQ